MTKKSTEHDLAPKEPPAKPEPSDVIYRKADGTSRSISGMVTRGDKTFVEVASDNTGIAPDEIAEGDSICLGGDPKRCGIAKVEPQENGRIRIELR